MAAAADQAGLDFLILTDHDHMGAWHDYGERYWGRTLVLVGAEITPRWNHYLVYGLAPHQLPSRDLPPARYVAQVAALGALGFCAHPYEAGSRVLRMPEYSWRDWDVDGFTGLEIWNYFSSWVMGCTTWPRALLAALGWWQLVAGDPHPEALARWDALGQRRRVVGIGGVDAHGVQVRLGPLRWAVHPYRRSFRTVRTQVLAGAPPGGDVGAGRAALVEALAAGRCYVANWERGDPTGFRFLARGPQGWLEMGQEVPHPGSPGQVQFTAAVPRGGSGVILRLLKDGQEVAAARGTALEARDQGPGVYRVEVRRRGRGWIYSNPIYLRAP